MTTSSEITLSEQTTPRTVLTNMPLVRALRRDRAARVVTGTLAALVALAVIALMAYVIMRGYSSISWEFLTQSPKDRMTAGGIYPAIVGTLWLIALTALFALPVGIATGVWLSEFAPRTRRVRALRVAVATMAGIPSVIYGLFGYAAFSIALGFNKSLLSMGLTLACVTLPLIITATEEALSQLPQELRHASLALGATRWRTVVHIVLPAAAPGILTGALLGLARAAGETAPILFTGVAFFAAVPTSVMQPSMALPYHLYIMATQPTTPAPHIVWGTALVLVGLLCGLSLILSLVRLYLRRKKACS